MWGKLLKFGIQGLVGYCTFTVTCKVFNTLWTRICYHDELLKKDDLRFRRFAQTMIRELAKDLMRIREVAIEAERNRRAIQHLGNAVEDLYRGRDGEINMDHFREVFCRRIAECNGPDEIEVLLRNYDYDLLFVRPQPQQPSDPEDEGYDDPQPIEEDQIEAAGAGFVLRNLADLID